MAMTAKMLADGARDKVIGMYWAWRSGKGVGPARTSLVGTMNVEIWEHQNMELEGG